MKPNTETKMSEAQEPVGYIDEFGNFEKSLQNWMIEEPGINWEPVYKDQTATITAQQEVIKQMREALSEISYQADLGAQYHIRDLADEALISFTQAPHIAKLIGGE